MKVNSDFGGDWMKRFDGLIGPMLEDGLSVLIYGALRVLFRSSEHVILGRGERQMPCNDSLIDQGADTRRPLSIRGMQGFSMLQCLTRSLRLLRCQDGMSHANPRSRIPPHHCWRCNGFCRRGCKVNRSTNQVFSCIDQSSGRPIYAALCSNLFSCCPSIVSQRVTVISFATSWATRRGHSTSTGRARTSFKLHREVTGAPSMAP